MYILVIFLTFFFLYHVYANVKRAGSPKCVYTFCGGVGLYFVGDNESLSKVGVTQLSAAFDMEYGFTTYVGIDYNMVLRQWENS